MKKNIFLIGFFLLFIAEIVTIIIFSVSLPDYSLDTIMVNEIEQTVKQDFNHIDQHQNVTSLDYVVLDVEGAILYKTADGLSEKMNDAIRHRDTIITIEEDGFILGKVIIYNATTKLLYNYKRSTMIVIIIIALFQGLMGIGYLLYLKKSLIAPFNKLKKFACRIAGGNLDIPLEMDRHNLFGAFTESFDMMRSELKKARIAQAEAEQSKKELVAKLSHDIKTPVASIKAVSEVGAAVSLNEKDQRNYSQIICKADQINTLVTNLFTATLEELNKLTVNPTIIDSTRIKVFLENSDYLHYAVVSAIPACFLYADELRIQQVLDNIFSNSYKYANTEINVISIIDALFLNLVIEDFGGGILEDELPFIKDKFKRGSNTSHIDGAGLGLYISDYFMTEMKGNLIVENGQSGLKVTIQIRLANKI